MICLPTNVTIMVRMQPDADVNSLCPATLRLEGLFDRGRSPRSSTRNERCREDRSETLLSLLTLQIWQSQAHQPEAVSARRIAGVSA